jgi:hypothetical protein
MAKKVENGLKEVTKEVLETPQPSQEVVLNEVTSEVLDTPGHATRAYRG